MKKIDITNSEYPESLKNINNPPQKIYCKGNVNLLKKYGIAIVGSRICSEYGKKIAFKFANELSKYDLVIVSGMAIGIDAFAHKGAIEYNGETIAVLPSGLEKIYPEENIPLLEEILQNNGLVITEYEPDKEANSQSFLERNRIVSGLAIGTLVVEGKKRSGASVTAGLTMENKKTLFCIPADINKSRGITPNYWIKKGAVLVTETKDIIQNFPQLKLECGKEKKENKKIIQKSDVQVDFERNIVEKKDLEECKNSYKIPNEYKEVYEILTDTPININDIAKELKVDVQEVSYKLLMLEMEGIIMALPGQNFKRVKCFKKGM